MGVSGRRRLRLPRGSQDGRGRNSPSVVSSSSLVPAECAHRHMGTRPPDGEPGLRDVPSPRPSALASLPDAALPTEASPCPQHRRHQGMVGFSPEPGSRSRKGKLRKENLHLNRAAPRRGPATVFSRNRTVLRQREPFWTAGSEGPGGTVRVGGSASLQEGAALGSGCPQASQTRPRTGDCAVGVRSLCSAGAELPRRQGGRDSSLSQVQEEGPARTQHDSNTCVWIWGHGCSSPFPRLL